MMDGAFVIDAVSHGYNMNPEIAVPPPVGPTWTREFVPQAYRLFHASQPEGAVVDYERWTRGADPELLGRALFAESQTDATVYHEVPLDRIFGMGGASPMWCGKEMRDRWPGRVALYGGASPFRADVFNRIDMLVDVYGVKGIKLYPIDLVEGRVVGIDMSDPEFSFPMFEHAQKRGVRNIAIHKAVPIGPTELKPYGVLDMGGAALAFPDLTFEIVHGGYAFLEETALQLLCFPNIVINLEGTTLLLPKAPRRFAEILGTLLAADGAERIMWATGATGAHPQPMLDAFRKLEMPQELIDGYGFPELTPEIKRAILGENAARIIGLDIEQMKRDSAGDEFSNLDQLAPMWSADANGWTPDAYRTASAEGYRRSVQFEDSAKRSAR